MAGNLYSFLLHFGPTLCTLGEEGDKPLAPSMRRTVGDVIDSLRQGKRAGRKCSLLIGAGCSVTAGIPTAQGFVDIICKDYAGAYGRAGTKSYPACMSELTVGQQRDLIASRVDRASINWAHLSIAQLIKEGHVDRVLTTNFDPLVVRACALVGEFPAIYDFAASQVFKPHFVPDKAVFHLHGQRSGFLLLNSDDEVCRFGTQVAPVFTDAGRGRVWIVVGYSGENDPVLEHLARQESFDFGLFWVGFGSAEPPAHIRDGLIARTSNAFYVGPKDADAFFVELCQSLEIFPPTFVHKPFSHLHSLLGTLTSPSYS